ncbi:hydrogenase expression/formation protein HypC [Alteromonadaceae bacterium 2753L.S.0a.02]|nr:hydrogenase expression/formation protein HypC [Alteromonadaceae bacterium 2753L.S.0a.02]
MCLAIPSQVVALDSQSDTATVTLGDVRKTISVALLDEVQVGDYVLVHVGYALEKISESEAQKTLQILATLGEPELADI